MSSPKLSRRPRILLLTLGVLSSVWLFNIVETRSLERGLGVVAGAKARELAADARKMVPRGTQADAVARVTVAKDYVLFGETRGKIQVYIRLLSPEHPPLFTSYDAFYSLRENVWIEVESGVCADQEAQTEGYAAFAAFEE